MKVITYVRGDLIKEPREIAKAFRRVLQSVVDNNIQLMTLYPKRYPLLYQSGIKYRPERRVDMQNGIEEFADCEAIIQRKWGDCDDLCAYRVAELRKQGINASIRIYWRIVAGKPRLFHVQVRLPNKDIEDPSRFLGMR